MLHSRARSTVPKMTSSLSPPSAPPPLACQRALFDLPDDDDADAPAYFDGAGRSPLMRSAFEAGLAALAGKLRPWTMPGGDDAVAEVRQLFAEPIDAGDGNGGGGGGGAGGGGSGGGGVSVPAQSKHPDGAECVALTPSTSYALSLAARNVSMRPGQRAVVLWGQMASNVMPWQHLCARSGGRLVAVRAAPPDFDWTAAVLKELDREEDVEWEGAEERQESEERNDSSHGGGVTSEGGGGGRRRSGVAVVALPNCHWADGSMVDLEVIGEAGRCSWTPGFRS